MAAQTHGRIGHYMMVIALMAATTAALYFFVDARIQNKPGIRIELPVRAGAWSGHEIRYCQNEACLAEFDADTLKDREICSRCGKPLFSMTKVEREVLPADTVFLKGRYTRDDGASLFVSIVLSGRDAGSIHRPQQCLVAQGMRIQGYGTIPVATGGRGPCEVMVLDIVPAYRPGMTAVERQWKGKYAYWFVGQRRITPYYLQMMLWLYWDRLVHGVAHRWAYIAVSGAQRTSPAELQRQVSDFIRAFYPQIAVP